MPKNHIKGTNRRAGSNKATGRDYSYDKKYQKSKKRVKYRVELNKANREAGTYGKMHRMGKDRSHTTDGKMVLEDMHKNRARNRGKKKC
jgi:hypothetical protein